MDKDAPVAHNQKRVQKARAQRGKRL
ncbi:TPA_asm: UL43.5 iORF [Human alphaherpesvirus 1]|nr:TPA_asm: UL43.5 iORF [Human alphaherpesvirus 1]